MRIYLWADIEGVAGVRDWQEWAAPGQAHFDEARELATLEVNAAVEGLCAGGAIEILVAEAHGPGCIDIRLLDSRADLLRGWGPERWPRCLDASFDALAFVGQHAKAGTAYGHLAHTLSTQLIDISINGISVGEFGALVLCAAELGIPTIFAAGDEALSREARELVPDIETVAVKRGLQPGTGEQLTREEYARFYSSAIHTHPVRARALITDGARRAVERRRRQTSGVVAPLQPPFERVVRLRASRDRPQPATVRATHPSSVIALLNVPFE